MNQHIKTHNNIARKLKQIIIEGIRNEIKNWLPEVIQHKYHDSK